MHIDKSKVAIVFMVFGSLTVLFGIIVVFAGPLIIDDQIIKVRKSKLFTKNVCSLLSVSFSNSAHGGDQRIQVGMHSSQKYEFKSQNSEIKVRILK